MTSASVLVPAKFLTIIGQLLATLVIFQTKKDNIFIAFHTRDEESDEYTSADSSITAALVLTAIFLCIELIILFIGVTLFYDKTNIMQCLLHGLGTIFYSWFILDIWHYDYIWMLWSLFSLIPLLFELLSILSSLLYYKNFTMDNEKKGN